MKRTRLHQAGICVALAALAQGAAAQLAYVEASSGLTVPRMEAGPTELEFADVNLDGYVDIVSIGDHGSPRINSDQAGLMVWFGDGAGGWAHFQTGNFGYGGVAIGDVDGDGLPDAGYAMHHNYSSSDFGDQLIEVALGDGTGRSWTPYDDGLATHGEDYGMFDTDFADVDNDGDLDLGAVSFGCCSGIHVYRNHGDGTWSQSFGFNGGNNAMRFFFGDVNGDGNADFAAGSQNGTVYFGDGAGGFTMSDGNLPARGQLGRRGVSLGDVDGDGCAELSFATSGGGLAVWRWVSGATWENLSGNLPTGGGYRLTQIADMNVDGRGDLVAFSELKTEVWLGDGAGGWTLAATIPTPANTCDYSTFRAGADVDHNGYPDLVSIVEENCGQFSGGRNRPRCYVEVSPRTRDWIFPLSFRGGRTDARGRFVSGETARAGSVRFVDWTAQVQAAPGDVGTVTIELGVSGPAGPWITIVRDAVNNGRHQWRIADDLPRSDRAHLRLTLETPDGRSRTVTPRPFRLLPSGEAVAGDADGDFDVDLKDAAAFQNCFSGEGGELPEGCDASDVTGDGAVDLADWMRWVTRMSGS
ncbi:MAG: hypothetical protein FLDDKLPJ_03719 [Phycisphaerae bacterium]|nr:hypothetical protein [Phycisphaerae bacterium]